MMCRSISTRHAAINPIPVEPPSTSAVATLLTQFSPISLDQMDAVALQNRTDTKYVLHSSQLFAILATLVGEYRILEIAHTRLASYQTIYFDTPDFMLYHQHHAGQGNRYKVRSRRYVHTNQSFFEVKLKTNKGRTVKQRIPTASLTMTCVPELRDFLYTQVAAPQPRLDARLWNRFSRITLVSRSAPERVTIDLGLRFGSPHQITTLPGVAVVEVKQAGINRDSAFIQQLHAAQIRPTSFSKYCVGVALLYEQIKHNRFKPILRHLEQLTGGNDHEY